ncbi:unnamed protein product [marine sediment metagenome]|uniref:Uncharacterized protein n=1 Tax=marine sediment metagenome TaxID=412755 RepID=X1T4D5_9ZZZZ
MELKKGIPVLKGIIGDGQIFVWCPHCRKYHIHGLGGGQDPGVPQHRVAHCSSDSSPFIETGYYIKVMPSKPD